MSKNVKPTAKKPYKPKVRTRLPNGFGSVTTLPGNRRRPFAARKTIGWTMEGSPIQKTLGYYETWAEAFEALTAYNRNPYDLEAATATLQDVFDKWSARKFSEVKNGKTLSDSGKNSYQAAFKHLSKIHQCRFRDLTTGDLQQQIDSCPRGRATQENIRLLINQLYQYAVEFDIVTKDLSKYLNLTKADSARKKVPFTSDEITRVWEKETELGADIVLVLLYTGMRVSEFLLMRKDHIFLDKRYMVGGLKTEAGRNRTIPIHEKIVPVIERLVANCDADVIYPEGYRVFINHEFDPLMKRLKMTHTSHECRHTFISQATKQGMDDTILKMIVGHARQGITEQVYTHRDPQQLVDEVNILNY